MVLVSNGHRPSRKSTHKARGFSLCSSPITALVVCAFVFSVLIENEYKAIHDHRFLFSSVDQKLDAQHGPTLLVQPPTYVTYNSTFLRPNYSAAEREKLNSESSENERLSKAAQTNATHYLHQDMPNYMYLHLLLRIMTKESIFVGPLHEPATNRITGERANRGCPEKSPKCILTWDGYARAMSAGDVLYDILQRKIPGHVVEVGVFKGGMSAYFQGLLKASGETASRQVWLVDSYQGLPPASLMTSAVDDSQSKFNSHKQQKQWAGELSVGVVTVRRNMDRLGLLIPAIDDASVNARSSEKEQSVGNVHFLEGFVHDTLPLWPNDRGIALLRVDVDIYSATYDALHYLYPRLVRGGAVLFDDWKFPYSREAIKNYRAKHSITTPIQFLDGCVDPMAYWIKE